MAQIAAAAVFVALAGVILWANIDTWRNPPTEAEREAEEFEARIW